MNIRLGIVAMGMALIYPLAASAAPIPNTTITFNDTSTPLSVSIDTQTGSPATSGVLCSGETCTINVLSPANTRISGSNTGVPLYILDPGSSVISDELNYAFNVNVCGPSCSGYTVTFNSATDETTGLGTYTTGDSITENGSIQTGFELAFFNIDESELGTATIQFQSDVDQTTAVPEPLTLSLFGAGLAGAIAMRRRRKA